MRSSRSTHSMEKSCGAAPRGAAGNIGSIHWQSPIVVNGWVYCSDESGNLTAYSLK
jgi:hypothetical protein